MVCFVQKSFCEICVCDFEQTTIKDFSIHSLQYCAQEVCKPIPYVCIHGIIGSLRKVRSVAMDVRFFKISTLRTPQFAERP